MTKKTLLLTFSLLLGFGSANAQNVYVSIEQNNAPLTSLGTASYTLNGKSSVEFINGKAVMTIDGNTVASLPMADGGKLVVNTIGTASATSTTVPSAGYATLYSPFQLKVPESGNIEVYAPTYNTTKKVLEITSTTQIKPGEIIPAGTGLILKNEGSISLASADGTPNEITSALSGSALKINKPTDCNILTLGHSLTDKSKYGFYLYTGNTLAAGKAYLKLETKSSQTKFVPFTFTEEDTSLGISNVNNNSSECGYTYNVIGQRLNANAKGLVIKNGKKYMK